MRAPVPLSLLAILIGASFTAAGSAGEQPTFAGPAMGTTYRVVLAAPISGVSSGQVHRDVEGVLARIDRAASTWREDSDVSRFNRAAAGEWLEVADDLVAIVEIAREVHEESQGAFDITAASAGMEFVETRTAVDGRPAAIRKTRDAVAIDLGGIGPGYAVDAIGARLLELGSSAHMVELGGEVRGWGRLPGETGWRVLLRPATGPSRVIELADGEAVATSTRRAGRSPLDPRTGAPAVGIVAAATVRAESCARADAWAVAAVVLDMAAGPDGTVTVPQAPSRPAVPPAARRAAP